MSIFFVVLKLAILFILASFSTCAGIVGGMFFLLVDYWSYKLLHTLRGIMDIMVIIHCLLVLPFSKLGGGGPIWFYKKYIFEPHV
jgi:hypothetical protein